MKRIICFISIFACCLWSNIKADNVKIHAVVFCNTNDEKIGESCMMDMERFVEELGVIEAAVDCEEDWHVYIGNDCTKPNLEKVLSGMTCNPNDVIFFYYSGHGVHAKADPADGWLPQMCLNYRSYNQDKFVPVTYVREQLKSKGARLNIIMTDCCNNEAEWVSVKGMLSQQKDTPQTDQMDVAKLRKLFLESKGTIIATSSKRGQVSLGTKDGGCFSIAFWNEIFRVERGDGKADWRSLMDETIKGTLQYSSNKQEPVYRVESNDAPAPSNNTNASNNGNIVVIAVGDNGLRDAFKQITNPNRSNSERWDMVSVIAERLFEQNALVTVVGRDLKTNVSKPVSAKEYLEDIALSKRVKGINIVRAQKNANGKYSQIVISEIR